MILILYQIELKEISSKFESEKIIAHCLCPKETSRLDVRKKWRTKVGV